MIEFRYLVDMSNIPSPASGYTIGYDLDGVLKQKDTTGLITLINVKEPEELIINIGEIVPGVCNNPITIADNDPFNIKMFGIVTNTFTTADYNVHYPYALYDIYEENGINVKGLQFATYADLVLYLNNNLAFSIGNTNKFYIKQYFKIDNNLKPFHYLGEKNMFFSSIKGRRNYGRHTITSATFHDSAFAHSVIDTIYLKIVGITTPSIGTYADALGTLWLPHKRKSYYSGYSLTTSNNFNDNVTFNGRFVYDSLTGTFISASLAPTMKMPSMYAGLTFSTSFVMTTNSNGSSLSYSLTTQIDEKIKDKLYLSTDATSFVRIHCLVDDFLSPRYYAFYLVPIGVDTFHLPEIENSAGASLYGFFYNESRIPMIRKVNSVSVHATKVSWRVISTDFMQYENAAKLGSLSKKKIRDFKFFYGYTDGSISPLSPEVKHLFNCPGSKMKRIVRH